MKPTLQDVRDILVTSSEGSDRHFWGVVTAQNTNSQGEVTSYEVALGGEEGTMTCRKLAGAEVGDTVMVTLTKTGMAVVTGTVDGDKDAAAAQETADAAAEAVETVAEDVTDLEGLVGDGDTSGITVETQYYLSTSNIEPTGGSWSADMPTYVSGRYYWTKTVTTYADGSTVETEPALDAQAQLTAEADYLLASVNNHFWVDEDGGTGAYVSQNNLSYSSGYALRMASSGIAQMYNGVVLNTLTSSGLSFYAYNSGSRTLLASYSSTGCDLYGNGTLGASVTSSGATFYGGSSSTYASMTSSGLDVVISGSDYGFFGSTARLGRSSYGHVTVGSSYMYFSYGSTRYGTLDYTSDYIRLIADTATNLLLMNGNNTLTMSSSESRFSYDVTVEGSSDSADALTVQVGRLKCPSIYSEGAGTSTSANVYVGSAGRLSRAGTSSLRKYKHGIGPIETADIDPHLLYDVDVIQFNYNTDYITDKNDPRYDRPVPGFIVDDLYDIYPMAVDMDDGEMVTWNPRYLIPPMLALIQEQHEQIDILTAKVDELERRN